MSASANYLPRHFVQTPEDELVEDDRFPNFYFVAPELNIDDSTIIQGKGSAKRATQTEDVNVVIVSDSESEVEFIGAFTGPSTSQQPRQVIKPIIQGKGTAKRVT